jgi:N utilization substance protein A
MSREETDTVVQLFKEEVPEIATGDVLIKAIARIKGVRTKLAVQSKGTQIDPVRACTGQGSSRISRIVNRLGGERIDILLWHDCVETFIRNALQPGRVEKIILHPAQHRATAIVAKELMLYVMGKQGENCQLASQLTGWQIDVVVRNE